MTPAAPAKATEREFQAQVVELAGILGWTVNHVRRSIGGKKQGWVTATTLKGWPDLTLIRPPRLLFVELKVKPNKVEPAQQAVLDLLDAVPGVEVAVWYPEQFEADVLRVLR